jgi:hypothetical protein
VGTNVGTSDLAGALGELSAALVAVRVELDAMEAANARLRAAIDDGVASHELLQTSGWADARSALLDSTGGLASQLKRTRSEYVRLLVDVEGMSISEAARVLGHPRQLIKRVYDALSDGSAPSDTI